MFIFSFSNGSYNNYYAAFNNYSNHNGAVADYTNRNSYTTSNHLDADNDRAANTAGNFCPTHAGF